jgi:hypothetical protein
MFEKSLIINAFLRQLKALVFILWNPALGTSTQRPENRFLLVKNS